MSAAKGPIRVLIVDDSSLMRQLLTIVLTGDPEIEVVGTAPDPFVARDMIKELNPDVVTLDVEMPRMDGLSFLRKLMELRPLPVIMISTLTQANADVTIKALEIGAVDFVAKPTSDITTSMEGLSAELRAKIKAAALIKVRARSAAPQRLVRFARFPWKDPEDCVRGRVDRRCGSLDEVADGSAGRLPADPHHPAHA